MKARYYKENVYRTDFIQFLLLKTITIRNNGDAKMYSAEVAHKCSIAVKCNECTVDFLLSLLFASK